MSGRNPFRTTVIGLSGGIASGKNLVAEIFAQKGAAIFDADKEVHKLLESDESTIAAVKKFFSESFVEGKIERKILGKIVFADEKKLRALEKILHPKVQKKYREFVAQAKKNKKEFVVLNVPLLLESETYKCDYVIAITAFLALRKKRFLARSKNSDLKIFNQIRAKQISDSTRKKRADFVITNNETKEDLVTKIEKILRVVT